jgi:probable phosphoglycerate mutase
MNPDLSFCTLYLVRHGETEWNTQSRIQGQLDSPLTPNGITATQKLAQKLQSVALDAIFASDLGRTVHTAKILKQERPLEINTHVALRERTFGVHDGSYGDVYDQEIQPLLTQYHQLPEEERWKFKFTKGYESDYELITRFTACLQEISAAHLGKTVLVVTHGGNLRTFLTHLGYAKHGELRAGTFKNAGYVKTKANGNDFFLEEVEGVDKSAGKGAQTL